MSDGDDVRPNGSDALLNDDAPRNGSGDVRPNKRNFRCEGKRSP